MSEKPVREHDKVMLRLPDGVRKMLKLQAEQNKRSLNAEIVARLLDSLDPWKPGDELTLYRETRTEFPTEQYDIDVLLKRLDSIAQKFSKGRKRDE